MSKRKPNNPRARVERFSRAVLRQHRVAVVNIDPAGWQGLVDYGTCKNVKHGRLVADAEVIDQDGKVAILQRIEKTEAVIRKAKGEA